jgi:hypothetical protein
MALEIREPVALELGGAVRVQLSPDPELSLRMELLNRVYFVPLRDLQLRIGTLQLAEDGWLELTPGARETYLGDLRVTHPVQLCRGDQLALSQGGPPVLGVLR